VVALDCWVVVHLVGGLLDFHLRRWLGSRYSQSGGRGTVKLLVESRLAQVLVFLA